MDMFKEASKAILAAVMAVVVAHCNSGCNPGKFPIDAGVGYSTAVANCAANATSYQDSCTCRKEVDRRYEICERWPTEGSCLKECFIK